MTGRCLILILALSAGPAWADGLLSGAIERFEQALAAGPVMPYDAAGIADRIVLYETTLADLRQAHRAARFREARLSRGFATQETQLLNALEGQIALARAGGALSLAHPEGPVAARHAELLLDDITDSLNQRVVRYRRDLADLERLRADVTTAERALTDGLAELQRLRLVLSRQAVIAKAGPFDKTASDLALLEQVVARARGSQIATEALDSGMGSDWAGNMNLPVRGVLERGFAEPDQAGKTRPGILIGAETGALVNSPATSTIRHVGKLDNFGALIILEPAQGYMMILAGLDLVLVTEGDVVDKDQALGFVSGVGVAPHHEEFLSVGASGAGGNYPQTLYMEIRENGEPIDPAVWFTF